MDWFFSNGYFVELYSIRICYHSCKINVFFIWIWYLISSIFLDRLLPTLLNRIQPRLFKYQTVSCWPIYLLGYFSSHFYPSYMYHGKQLSQLLWKAYFSDSLFFLCILSSFNQVRLLSLVRHRIFACIDHSVYSAFALSLFIRNSKGKINKIKATVFLIKPKHRQWMYQWVKKVYWRN